jgi:hypothetical protein
MGFNSAFKGLMAWAGTTLGPTLFGDITRRRAVNPYRRFGTIYRSHLQGSRSDIPAKGRSHLVSGGITQGRLCFVSLPLKHVYKQSTGLIIIDISNIPKMVKGREEQ